MSENEVEIGHDTREETAKQEVAKKPKRTAKAAVSQQPDTKVEKKATAIEEVMATIKTLTVLELSKLIKALEAEFGVSAAAPVVATAPVPAEVAAPAEEQTEFSLILKDIGANKISVIKAVRELTTLGLKESKDFVESAPKVVKEGVTRDEATAMKQKLEAAGATVEIT